MVLFSGCPGEAVVLFEIQNPAGSLGTSKKRRLRYLEESGCRVLGEPG